MKNDIYKKITIKPYHQANSMLILGIIGIIITILLIILTFILLIIDQKYLFDVLPLNKGKMLFCVVLLICITFPITMFRLHVYRGAKYKIIFTDIFLLIIKGSKAQDKRLKIQCKNITDYKYTADGAKEKAQSSVFPDYISTPDGVKENAHFFVFLELHCYDGKKYKLFVTSFTEKQIIKILKMIQERGGLKDHQDFENFKRH